MINIFLKNYGLQNIKVNTTKFQGGFVVGGNFNRPKKEKSNPGETNTNKKTKKSKIQTKNMLKTTNKRNIHDKK